MTLFAVTVTDSFYIPDDAPLVELRADRISDLKKVKTGRPVLLTAFHSWEEVDQVRPLFVDIDAGKEVSYFKEFKRRYPGIQVIASHHDFEKVPDLESVYREMKTRPADLYKIAVMVNSSLETLRCLAFLRSKRDVIVVTMGEMGQFGRLLGAIYGNPITYCCLDEPKAPGQMTLSELKDVYHLDRCDKDTKIYGLIGDPVDLSISHITHNRRFCEEGANALYVKMAVQKSELKEFLKLAEEAGFSGLSVTMPLKEEAGFNTLKFTEKGIIGINTDGIGAIRAIGEVKDKKVVLLGAGGTAKAIYRALIAEGADVIVCNRTLERAKAFAKSAYPIEDFPKIGDYDILIQATSVGFGDEKAMVIPNEWLKEKKTVLDVVSNPEQTALLKAAYEKGCRCLSGKAMFFKQAEAQFDFWYEPVFSTA